jgi:hypothetical protein
MPILRIITSVHSKIVINSPEVQLGITRPHAEVGHKFIVIFIYKYHLDRSLALALCIELTRIDRLCLDPFSSRCPPSSLSSLAFI